MVFNNQNFQYRITLDTKENLFIAIDANNEMNTATGATIEEATMTLKNQLVKE